MKRNTKVPMLLPELSKRRRGLSIIELAIALPILLAITFLSVNLMALAFGADYCDKACQDCARAAGAMSTPDDAVNAMNAASKAYAVDGNFFNQLYPELLIYEDYNTSKAMPTPQYGSTKSYKGCNGPNNITPKSEPPAVAQVRGEDDFTDKLGPHVVVRTTLIMKIPITISLFGGKVFVGNVEVDMQQFKFQSTYTFPIVNTFTSS
jgi:hypothetical protein